jgi:hypothetical protein
MADVLDYSGWRPDPRALKAAGIVGVSRYLAPVGTGDWKRIGKAEYDATLAAGLAVVLNWEDSATGWHGGYAKGVEYGRTARAQARALGHPDSRPIIVSIDSGDQLVTRDASGAILVPARAHPVAVEHVRGFVDGSGTGPQAVYAGTNVIEECHRQGLIRFGWQAAASSWSTVPSAHVALVQHVQKPYAQFPPAAYDWNTTVQPDWGQVPFTRRGAATLED